MTSPSPSQRPDVDFPSRIGVWWASEAWAMPDAQAVARDIESLGYGSLFIPEIGFKDALVESMAFLSATERLVVGTGIANIHVRCRRRRKWAVARSTRSSRVASCSASG